jgi:hypothetical protein
MRRDEDAPDACHPVLGHDGQLDLAHHLGRRAHGLENAAPLARRGQVRLELVEREREGEARPGPLEQRVGRGNPLDQPDQVGRLEVAQLEPGRHGRILLQP